MNKKSPDDLFVEETQVLTRVVNTDTDLEVTWDPNALNDVRNTFSLLLTNCWFSFANAHR